MLLKNKPKRILVSNDDGIDAVGIKALSRALSKKYEVVVVAPAKEMSATSHSITVRNSLSYKQIDYGYGIKAYAVTGTPADCVKFAVLHLIDGVDLVVSGINRGLNVGSDTMYSGTVAAAREGKYLNKPSIAVSLDICDSTTDGDYEACAEYIAEMLDDKDILDACNASVLNINYPAFKPKGEVFTGLGIQMYDDSYEIHDEACCSLRGRPIPHDLNNDDCDVEWVRKGYITLTPLLMDMTDCQLLSKMKNRKPML